MPWERGNLALAGHVAEQSGGWRSRPVDAASDHRWAVLPKGAVPALPDLPATPATPAAPSRRGGPSETAAPSPGPLSPSWLLDGTWAESEREAAAGAVLGQLRLVGALMARLDLALGSGLAALCGRFDIAHLGHSHFDDLCFGRLGFSGAHGRELRTLATGLAERPHLRRAFRAGLLSRARVRAVLRIATAEDEAGWTPLARRLSTRALEALVRDVRAGRRSAPSPDGEGCVRLGPAEDASADEAAEHVRVDWRGTREDRLLWKRHGLALVRTVVGVRGPEHALAEALAADALATLGHAPAESPPAESPDIASRATGQGVRAPLQRRGRRRGRRRGPPSPERLARLARRLTRAMSRTGVTPLFREPAFDECGNAWDVHGLLTGLASRRAALEWERARLLAVAWRHALHRPLGLRSVDQLVQGVLGLGPRDAASAVEAERRLAFLPALDAAWREGRLTTRSVSLLLRVVEPETEADWIAHARDVTPKLLELGVSWAEQETLRRESEGRRDVVGRATPGPVGPPRDETPRALLADWRTALAARRREERRGRKRGAQHVDSWTPPSEALRAVGLAGGACGVLGRVPTVRIGFDAPPGVAATFWAAMDAVRNESGLHLTDAECVRVLLTLFARAHLSREVERQLRRHRAIERDGWRCQAPHCRAVTDFHEHHRRYRSAGGGDELENLVTLCRGCHAMVHAGLLRIAGEAPDALTWSLGSPAREVYRNERRVPGPAPQWCAAPSAPQSSAPQSWAMDSFVNR